MVTSDRLRLVKCKMLHFNNHTYLLLGSLNLKPIENRFYFDNCI